ncbi:MAG: hypothetical protein QM541_05885 [Flavobacterium sp.]|nr:hypothetical protein [Flavobacterium sp.]
MRKIFLLPLAILILNIGVSQNVTTDLSQIVKKVENSVFIIYTFNKNNEPIAQGSGFFISNTGIGITNFHVLEGCTNAIIKP